MVKQSANAVTANSLMMEVERIEVLLQAARPEGHKAERWQWLSHVTAWHAVTVSALLRRKRKDWDREPSYRQQRRDKFTFILLLAASSWLKPLFVLCSRQVLHPVITWDWRQQHRQHAARWCCKAAKRQWGCQDQALAHREHSSVAAQSAYQCL